MQKRTDAAPSAAAAAIPTDGDRPALAPEPRYLPGILSTAILTAAAIQMQNLSFPPFQVGVGAAARHPVSAAIIAMVTGLLIRGLLPRMLRSHAAGCRWAVNATIPLAIIAAGAELKLVDLRRIGVATAVVALATIPIAVVSCYLAGRWLGLGRRLALLLGAGTGICGNSAIVAVAPLIDAKDHDLAISVGTINLFGLLAMLAVPAIAPLAGLNELAAGVWAGASVHAVPQAVAAGYAVSPDAGAMATLAKLVRVAALAPMVALFALVYAKRSAAASGAASVRYSRLVPWYVWAFAAMATLALLGWIPTLTFPPSAFTAPGAEPLQISLIPVLKQLGMVLLTAAMAAIGLQTDIRALAHTGARALLAGLLGTVATLGASLALVLATR